MKAGAKFFATLGGEPSILDINLIPNENHDQLFLHIEFPMGQG